MKESQQPDQLSIHLLKQLTHPCFIGTFIERS